MTESVQLPAIASQCHPIVSHIDDTTASLLSSDAAAGENDTGGAALRLLRPAAAEARKIHKCVKTPSSAGQALRPCGADKMLAMPHFLPVETLSTISCCHAGHAKSSSRQSTHEGSTSSHVFVCPHHYYSSDGMHPHRPTPRRDDPLEGAAARDVAPSREADMRAVVPHRASIEARPWRWSMRSFSDIYTRPHLVHCICDADSSASATTEVEPTSYNEKAGTTLRGNDSVASAQEAMANHAVHSGVEKPRLLKCSVQSHGEAGGGNNGQLRQHQQKRWLKKTQPQRRTRLLVPLREDPVQGTKYPVDTNDDGYERAVSCSPPMSRSLTQREPACVGLCAVATGPSYGREWGRDE